MPLLDSVEGAIKVLETLRVKIEMILLAHLDRAVCGVTTVSVVFRFIAAAARDIFAT